MGGWHCCVNRLLMCREWRHFCFMRRCWFCACVCFCRHVAASISVFGFWTIGLCAYVFLRRVCDRVTCSLCGWIYGSIGELTCVSARCNCVFPRRVAWWLGECSRGCITGCVDVTRKAILSPTKAYKLIRMQEQANLHHQIPRTAFPVSDISLYINTGAAAG